MNDELVDALVKLNRTEVLEITKKEIEKGTEPLRIIEKLSQGLKNIGRLFEKKEYYLAELITGADIFKNAFNEIKPILKKKGIETQVRGKIAVGTVQGDIHDIGKNIIITMLTVSGFDVIDLGVDVPARTFIEAITQYNVEILGLSALLTVSVSSVKQLLKLLEEKNLKNKVKIIVGGAAFTEDIAKKLGVDAFGKDPQDAVKKCEELLA